MRKILITGPESTGKSELSAALARHFGAIWVPEYARTFLTDLHRPYTQADLLAILDGQLAAEREAEKYVADNTVPPYVFCDTGPEVIYIWSQVRFGRVAPPIERALHEHTYQQTLLCYPDLPWEADPLREAPDEAVRQALFEQYARLLMTLQRPFTVIRGQGEQRLGAALTGLR